MANLVDCCDGGDPYECHCSYHKNKLSGIMTERVMACCEMSPCGLRIKIGLMQLHIGQCEKCQNLRNKFVVELCHPK